MKQSWPSKTIFSNASSCFGSVWNRSSPPGRRISNKILSTVVYICLPNSQQLIQSCAVTTRPVYRALLPVRMLQDRTLPDLPSTWPWKIWVRDYFNITRVISPRINSCFKSTRHFIQTKDRSREKKGWHSKNGAEDLFWTPNTWPIALTCWGMHINGC